MSRSAEELTHDYAELAAQTGRLCRVAELFSDKVKNPEWAEGLIEEIETTRRILSKAPPPQNWDGELRESDLEIKMFRAPGQDVRAEAVGVEIVHRPTGIAGKSYSKSSQLQNREVVMAYLRRKVTEHYAEMQG